MHAYNCMNFNCSNNIPMVLSQGVFAACLNQRFQLADAGGGELELIAVRREQASLPGQEAYSLLFAGALPMLPQATYALTTATLGCVELFLVPVARDGDRVHYQAVFN